MEIKKVKLELIKPSKFNVREELALDEIDISEGIIHKPIVKPIEDGYEIIIGHRRIEKARKYAEEHMGEFSKVTKTFYCIYMRPRTIEEIRKKYWII